MSSLTRPLGGCRSTQTGASAKAFHRLFHKFVLVEAHGVGVYAYDHMENVAQDPNLTVECLQRTLKKVEKAMGKLPDTLFIQMDNCWRENKNNTVIHWLVSLRARGLFPGGIEVSFLPKGHTHNEMDQHASRISVGVRRTTIFTRSQLVEKVKASFRGMLVERVKSVANTSLWLNPRDSKRWTGSQFHFMNNISTRRFFRISTDSTGRLQIQFKDAASQDDWSDPWPPMRRNDAYPVLPSRTGQMNVLKPLGEATRALVQKHVGLVVHRVPPEFLDELDDDLKCFMTTVPSQFHWEDGGAFAQEAEGGTKFFDEVYDPAAAVEFQRPPRVYDNPLRPGTDPDGPGFLLRGNFVAIFARRGGAGPTAAALGFRLGRIEAVDPIDNRVTVRWYQSEAKKLDRAKWRPYNGEPNTVSTHSP